MKKDLVKVQEYLKENNTDGFLFLISDDHCSEYIPNYYKIINFLVSFSGSNGYLLVTKDNSYLWTDGRYFLQAASQLKETNTKLMKMGIDESLISFIASNIKSLATSFKMASSNLIETIKLASDDITLIDNDSLIDSIWENRPSLINKDNKIIVLSDNLISIDCNTKLKRELDSYKKDNFGVLVSDLADIAYLTNLRGNDISYNPVFISYLFLTRINGKDNYNLYSPHYDELSKILDKDQINVLPYEKIYDDVASFEKTIILDKVKTNYKLYSLAKNKEEQQLNVTKRKAIKDEKEIMQSKAIHVNDGIAMTKFMIHVKENLDEGNETELSLMDYLETLRRNQGAIELSFNTICGYKEHGAIIHYGSTEKTNVKVYKNGLLLVDSGGQYLTKNSMGTTDITRTFVLGNITSEEKYHFTLVLKSHIDLAMASFDFGTTDKELDKLARKPLNDVGLDYNHGTGHGIGHFLNVHEGPQSISINKKTAGIPMEEGMITSCEPGLYFESKYGIRHENEILCVKKGNQLSFVPLTLCPFDLDGIDVTLLDDKEKEYLNNYHKYIYDSLSNYLDENEKDSLRHYTREI